MWGLRLECCKKCGCTFQIRRGFYEGYGGMYEDDGLCYWCKYYELYGQEATDDEFDSYCKGFDLFADHECRDGCICLLVILAIFGWIVWTCF